MEDREDFYIDGKEAREDFYIDDKDAGRRSQ
jgi:hypothetical protein